MDPHIEHLLCLICLRVLADTNHSCRWTNSEHGRGLRTRFRILGITPRDFSGCWNTLEQQGLIEQQGTELRLTPLGYLQSQMPYFLEHQPRSWYEHVVHHLYSTTPSPRKQVLV